MRRTHREISERHGGRAASPGTPSPGRGAAPSGRGFRAAGGRDGAIAGGA